MSTRSKTGRALVIVLMLCALSGCRGSGKPIPPKEGTAIIFTGGFGSTPTPKTLGTVIGVSNSYRIARRITLKSLQGIIETEGLEFLTSRVSFIGRQVNDPAHSGVNGLPVVICTKSWPPKSLGPTYAVPDLVMEPEDYFAPIIYVRIKKIGDWRITGFVFTYEEDGVLRRQTVANVEFTLKGRAKGRPCLPAGAWFGDSPSPTPTAS